MLQMFFLYHLLMTDNHFLEVGLLFLFQSVVYPLPVFSSVCSHLAYSYPTFSHLFFSLVFSLILSLNVSFVCHYLHNQYKALLSLPYQPSGCKDCKSHQVRPMPNTSASILKYIPICTSFKIA